MNNPARRDPIVEEFRNEMLNLFRMAGVSDRYERDLLKRFDRLTETEGKSEEES